MVNLKNEIEKLCLCPKCPSWVECKEKGAYCYPVIGKSKCITQANGCICGACPVQKKYKIDKRYYCINGSEKTWPEK
ncbi:MAG: DUF2769 domain-containing protein [archaeon]|jgi:hypothetical protein